MAAPIHHPVTGAVVGVVSLAGPTSRLPDARLKELAPALLEAASDMGAATLSSPYFKRPAVKTEEAVAVGKVKKKSVNTI